MKAQICVVTAGIVSSNYRKPHLNGLQQEMFHLTV